MQIYCNPHLKIVQKRETEPPGARRGGARARRAARRAARGVFGFEIAFVYTLFSLRFFAHSSIFTLLYAVPCSIHVTRVNTRHTRRVSIVMSNDPSGARSPDATIGTAEIAAADRIGAVDAASMAIFSRRRVPSGQRPRLPVTPVVTAARATRQTTHTKAGVLGPVRRHRPY